jgi:tetratricopeptide (TPR) repeat protein
LAHNRILVCFFLAAIVFVAFWPTLGNNFVGYDDGEYVTDNVHVTRGLTGQNIVWAFTTAHSSNWHPLTWLSHALDCALFGLNPTGHHLTSLLLHVANTILLFLWLSGATGFVARSAFVAAFFGLHPLHVESVAWVAERKDVLSTLFWLLTLIAYAGYVTKPAVSRYVLVAALFTVGLLSKQMLVSVPLLLLVLDWWPLERKQSWKQLAIEKLPLMFLAALASAVAIWAQRQSGSAATTDQLPVSLRLSNAVVSYVRYLWKTIWPVNLAVFYPFPINGIPAWQVAGSLLLLAAAWWLVFTTRKQRPWLAAGWLWYLLTLAPVIGIVQVGMQAMADRYMYVPMIGLLIAATWECAVRFERSRLLPVAASLALAACVVLSQRQIRVWKDGITLFTHALEVTEDNFVAHDNLGVELDRRGRFDEALFHYRETLRIKPGDRHGEQNFAQAAFEKGARLFAAGNLQEALATFREGLRYRPRNALAHTYLGLILTQQRQLPSAIAELRKALEIEPMLARAHMGLGVALAWSGEAVEAAKAFRETVRYDPSNMEAYYDLGLALASQGRNTEALDSFDAALRIKPDFEPAQAAHAETLAQIRRR